MKRVFIIASSDLTRAGLESLLAAAGVALVGSSSDEHGVINAADDLAADVVITVLSRPTEEALVSVSSLSAETSAAVIVLIDEFEASWSASALRAGARAVLSTEATSAEILAAIEAVSAGLVVMPEAAVHSMFPEAADRSPTTGVVTSQQKLTPREIEILGLIAEGLGNKEIAWRLDISDHTVKFHVGSIFTKLGAQSRTEAVTMGIRNGLIML